MKTRLLLAALTLAPCMLFAADDGVYQISEVTPFVWDGTAALVPQASSVDYDTVSGDDETISYNLPASFSGFTFYRQSYNQITVDTNGNIWFGNPGSAYGFSLPYAGKGPVISVLNSDQSSYLNGGVFIQHKSSPERVVIEWQGDDFNQEGSATQNNFAAILYPDGTIRFDYKTSPTANSDAGSGISKDDHSHYLSTTTLYGAAYNLGGRSFQFKYLPLSTATLNLTFSGTGRGVVVSTPTGIACSSNCSATFNIGDTVTLQQTPSYSTFSGWSGPCSGTGDCQFTFSADSTVTATFQSDTAHQVYLTSGSANYHSTIQNAYNAANNDATIKTWDVPMSETINLNRDINIQLQGGYNSGYTTQTGTTAISGSLTVSKGSLVVGGVAVQ